jgi:hypothetical protein
MFERSNILNQQLFVFNQWLLAQCSLAYATLTGQREGSPLVIMSGLQGASPCGNESTTQHTSAE